jgi:hypothetical protein
LYDENIQDIGVSANGIIALTGIMSGAFCGSAGRRDALRR